jgi:hypothetical protein
MKRVVGAALVAACLAISAVESAAQQRPLLTEDPETIGAGLILIEGGVDHQRDIFYPVSGLKGDLLRVPTLGVSFGISSIAELQVDGGIYQSLSVAERRDAPLAYMLNFTGDDTADVEDITVATKIRLLSETAGRPAIAIRLATRLPNAGNESGLGLDTTDVFIAGLIGKTIQSIRIVGNVGLGILPDPTRGDRQNDVLTYGFSLARAVYEGVEVVGEINGRVDVREVQPPPGTDTRGALRLGGRFTRGTVRIDGGVIIGMTPRDPAFGVTAGFTWVFKGFTLP